MRANQKGATFIEGLVVTVIVLVVIGFVGVCIASIAGLRSPTSGQHTGIVTSVEQNGVIWKTYSAYIKTSAQATQEDRYCVTNPAVVVQLQQDADAVKEVTVHYGNGLFIWWSECKGADESIITSVE